MLRVSTLLLTVAAAAGVALADGLPDDRDLLRKAAQDHGTGQPAPPTPADELSAAEQAARAEAHLALARLEIVLARKAVRAADYPQAARHAARTLELLRQLPPELDASEYELQAEAILARTAAHGVHVADLTPQPTPAPLPPPAAGPSPEPVPVTRRPQGDRWGYRPGRPVLDEDALAVDDPELAAYQGALRDAYKADEARVLIEADGDRRVPRGDVAYPPDWPQRMKRRAQYAGGQIARSSSWYDADGNEWYVAVYDIHDLIYVPPDFTLSGTFGVLDPLQATLDRDAWRQRSFFFGGGYDYAAGLPLWAYFGGINPWHARPATYDLDRQREIVEMISAFTGTPIVEPELSPPPSGRD